MNATRLPRYAYTISQLVISLAIGMLIPFTAIVPASFVSTANPYQEINSYPLTRESLEGVPFAAISEKVAETVQMVLDDDQLETVYGLNDDTNSYQFIWFNRFTPQTTDFPFFLNEIWIMFDDTHIAANIDVGDGINLVVYSDTDTDPTNGATLLANYSSEILAVDGESWSKYTLSPPLMLADPGDVLIGVINRYVISGVSEPSFPAAIDNTTSQERSWIGWWNGDPPDQPELPPDGGLVLMTGQNAGNWLIRGYGGPSVTYAYLPLVRRYAPLPSAPTLYDIDNADGDGSYTIYWSTSSLATSYTLEEDDNSNFSSPTVIFSGSETSKAVVGKAIGSYYYRVRAENAAGSSGWSQVRTVYVTQQTGLICETHSFGTPGTGLPIQPSGSTEHFSAENTMLIETVEVKSMLKALFPMNVYVAVGVNGEQLANKNHYVYSNVYTAYYINKDVAKTLHVGDDIYYYIAKAVGDPEAWIGWGNTVKICGR